MNDGIDFQPTSSGSDGIDFQSSAQPDQGSADTRSSLATSVAWKAVNDRLPWNQLRNATIQPLGEAIASKGGQMFPNHPYAAAAAGTAVAIAPELLSSYLGLKGLYNAPSPTVQGLVNTPKGLSPQFAAQNEAIGISDRVPETGAKAVYEDPYQYPSQLTKPKYVRPSTPELPIIQSGSKTGDPHAVFAYNDNFGPNGTPRSVYNVFGDQAQLETKGVGWGSSLPAESLQEKGIPVVGRDPNSLKYQPITQNTSTVPTANPGGASFTRPKPQIPAEPLPGSVPVKYPDDPGALINQANTRVTTHGTNLTAQELSDYKQLLQTKMANGEIPRFDQNGKPTQIWAQASKAARNVSDALNQVAEPRLQNATLPEGTIPTRAGLNQAYSLASKQQAISDLIKKYGLNLGKTAGGALGAKKLYDYFRQ